MLSLSDKVMRNSFVYVRLQINKVTSWIDGSFVYSSSEAWANTMRTFKNGSLLMEQTRQFPVRNTMRAPLFNHAVPHVMRMLSPERLYRKQIMYLHTHILFQCTRVAAIIVWHLIILVIPIKRYAPSEKSNIKMISKRSRNAVETSKLTWKH